MVPEIEKNDKRYHFAINGWRIIIFVSFLIFPSLLSLCAGSQPIDAVVEAKKTMERADAFMGDWQGGWELDNEADSGSLVAQVIALGKGQYRAVLSYEFDTRREPVAVLDGRRDGVAVNFAGRTVLSDSGTELEIQAAIKDGEFSGSFKGDQFGSFGMSKVVRLSPTLGAKHPDGAIVLFNGKDFKKWKHPNKKEGEDKVKWELVDGAMRVKPRTGSIITRKQFTDVKLHIEFRTPFMPEKRGQGRGNSGVYLQGRYEVQVLDSYGLEGRDNECGGIYKVGRPLVNMCAPPTQWQTYDITFRAPRFDSAGNSISKPALTVLHNGVKVHDKTEAKGPTTASLGGKASKPGPIYLQDHGNKVEFRNIWLVEL
jgi:hypothetical protein